MLELEQIRNVGVVGAGTMGAGIAQVCLGAGYAVHLHDAVPAQLGAAAERIRQGLAVMERKEKIPSAAEAARRLETHSNLAALSHCQWVIEAVREEEATKAEVLGTLGRLCRPEAVLASNTSSISITRLGAASGRPERFLGMHFFNPAPVMALVELVPGVRTAAETLALATALAERLGKTPVAAADRPGFIANRILMPLINEAARVLEEGVGSAGAIDAVARLGLNHPMGPLALADFIGLDVCLAILEVLHRELGDPRFSPSPLLRRYVEAGWLGRKTGRGFYSYDSSSSSGSG